MVSTPTRFKTIRFFCLGFKSKVYTGRRICDVVELRNLNTDAVKTITLQMLESMFHEASLSFEETMMVAMWSTNSLQYIP